MNARNEILQRLLACSGLATFALLGCLPAQAQQRCAAGVRASVTGTIQAVEQERHGPLTIWMIRPRGQTAGTCAVESLLGDVQLPGECAQGRSFSASGKIADAEGAWLLHVERIQCK